MKTDHSNVIVRFILICLFTGWLTFISLSVVPAHVNDTVCITPGIFLTINILVNDPIP